MTKKYTIIHNDYKYDCPNADYVETDDIKKLFKKLKESYDFMLVYDGWITQTEDLN